MTARAPRNPANSGAWKFEQVCDFVRERIDRLGPDSGNYTYQDVRRGEWEALRAFIRGLEKGANKPHFPKEESE